MKKVYIAVGEYDEFIGEFPTIEEMLTTLKDEDLEPADVILYECVKGTYVPPQGEATVIFGGDR